MLLFASSANINRPCARAETSQDLHVHGRLAFYDGGYPNLRLWQIGTRHLFGIYSDSVDMACNQGSACFEENDPKLPKNLEVFWRHPYPDFVYGDFELRLLEPSKPGHMQAACIVSADHLIRQHSK